MADDQSASEDSEVSENAENSGDSEGGEAAPVPHAPQLHGPRGIAEESPEAVRARILGGWDALLTLADAGEGDLRAFAALGSWPGRPVLGALMAAARGETPTPRRPKPFDPSRDEVLAALAEGRERVAAALDEVLPVPELGRRLVDSPLGPLPVLTQIHAMGHELAQACAGAEIPRPLADAGLAAMVDVVGALAWRQRLPSSAGLWEPQGPAQGGEGVGWVFTADADGWRTRPRTAEDDVPGVEGAAEHLLVSSGSLPSMIAKGEIRLRRVGGLLALAPLVDQVPNLPGGTLLRRAVSAVSVLSRLPGFK
ncbi:DinB family protein [Streptacidiphilus sp. MAP5-3]|uniref:DinB family protein n=1 Tax=unclassified Streptacidiphilus TaxID=2643834 RepID=UPI0035190B2D